MCGRFALATSWDQLVEEFFGEDLEFKGRIVPRYNISPSQELLVIPNIKPKTIDFARWGLIPSWTKSINKSTPLINARSESLTQKPSFKQAYKKRRCLIPASGFFEWKKVKGGKQTYFIRLKTKGLFAFAGLWEQWVAPDQKSVTSCTVITTQANTLLSAVHDRMPVILPVSGYDTWLEPDITDENKLNSLLIPYPSIEMEAFEVSSNVNKVQNDDVINIHPLPQQLSF